MDYYFQDNLRWNLGWDTPNHAGAFLATLLPLLWIVSGCLWRLVGRTSSVSSIRRAEGPHEGGPSLRVGLRVVLLLPLLAVLASEFWLWWALAKTYSRGAWVGLGCGAAVWFALWVWKGRAGPLGPPNGHGHPISAAGKIRTRLRSCAPWLLRGAVVLVCLFVSNFSARLAPDYTLADRSALNRIDLWKGGLELIAASPVRGWGWGESGAAFMQWTQPLDRTEGYKSMVNSYLTVAVEAGLPLFALLLAIMLIPLASGVWLARRGFGWQRVIATGLCACWASWLGCLFFSNLWIIPKLWVIPMVVAVALVAGCAAKALRFSRVKLGQFSPQVPEPPKLEALRCTGALLGLGLVAGTSLWIAGLFFSQAKPLRLTREAGGMVTLGNRGEGDAAWLDVYPDARVLGESYGHELRRWLLVEARPLSLRIQYPITSDSAAYSDRSAVIFGEQASRVPVEGCRVLFVHPIGEPPAEASEIVKGSRVVLPGIDPTGARYRWEAWATERGMAVELNHGLSLDVRVKWPELVTGF